MESLISTNISEKEMNEWYEDLQQIIKDHIIIYDLRTKSSMRDLSCEKRETIMEELERVSEYWYERGEENILTIICEKRGPYRITGNEPEYRVIFNEKDETVIPIEEFKEFCAEQEVDVEKILNEIRN